MSTQDSQLRVLFGRLGNRGRGIHTREHARFLKGDFVLVCCGDSQRRLPNRQSSELAYAIATFVSFPIAVQARYLLNERSWLSALRHPAQVPRQGHWRCKDPLCDACETVPPLLPTELAGLAPSTNDLRKVYEALKMPGIQSGALEALEKVAEALDLAAAHLRQAVRLVSPPLQQQIFLQ